MSEQEKRGRGRPKGSRNKATRDARAMYEKLSRMHNFEAMDCLMKIGATEMELYNQAIAARDYEARTEPARQAMLAAKELMQYYYYKPKVDVQEGEQGELVFTFSPEVRAMYNGESKH